MVDFSQFNMLSRLVRQSVFSNNVRISHMHNFDLILITIYDTSFEYCQDLPVACGYLQAS